jgi:hypothetical protein
VSALLRVSGFDQANTSSDASDELSDVERTCLQERDGSEAKARHDSKDSDCGSFHSSVGLWFVELATNSTIQGNECDSKSYAGACESYRPVKLFLKS